MATPAASSQKKATFAGLAIAVLIGGYTLLQPVIHDATGWNLPAIAQPDQPAAPVAVETTKPESDRDESPRYGSLRDVGNQRYISPAGLIYASGSAQGHRLEHIRRHTADQPNRPGKHGVFDGGIEGALLTIDHAYENAKVNRHTSKQTDQNRTIYTVDMGKRVGYVGGRDGNRDRRPTAHRVRLVLEGNRVITAFPL